MNYIVVKLMSGEEILAACEHEDDHFIQLLYPMVIYNDEILHKGVLKRVAKMTPYCPYSDERVFMINKNTIVHVSPLNKALIESYKVLVDAYTFKEGMEALKELNAETLDSYTSEDPDEDLDELPLYTPNVPGNNSVH